MCAMPTTTEAVLISSPLEVAATTQALAMWLPMSTATTWCNAPEAVKAHMVKDNPTSLALSLLTTHNLVLVSQVAPAVFAAPTTRVNIQPPLALAAEAKSIPADNLFLVASGACETVSFQHIQATIERDLQNWL
jgi:hypothetical protein